MKNFNLTVLYDEISKGNSPKRIAESHALSLPNLSYYLRQLKQQGFIRKVGYGTWEVCKEKNLKELQKTTPPTTPDHMTTPPSQIHSPKSPALNEGAEKSGRGGNAGGVLPTSSVRQLPATRCRGHAFIFRIKLPNIPGWKDKRTELLKAKGLEYVELPANQGQRIWIADNKVWLCNNSIVLFFRDSFFAETARGSNLLALAKMKDSIKQIERRIGVSLSHPEGYIFKTSRNHFSDINNSLARQYNQDGTKLEVRNLKGQVFCLIDNSHHLNELEFVHTLSGVSDSKKIVEDWLIQVQGLNGFTPQFILSTFAKTSEYLTVLTENVATMVKEIEKLKERAR